MVGEVPDALRLVGDERRLPAEEALVPRLRRFVVANADAGEEVHAGDPIAGSALSVARYGRWPLNEMTCWIPLGRFV